MRTVDALFADSFEIAGFHDAVIGPLLTHNCEIPTGLCSETLRDIYDALPERISSIGANFGLHDTEFRDEVYRHIEDGVMAFREDILKEKKRYDVGWVRITDRPDLLLLDIFVNELDVPAYIRFPAMNSVELLEYLSTNFPNEREATRLQKKLSKEFDPHVNH